MEETKKSDAGETSDGEDAIPTERGTKDGDKSDDSQGEAGEGSPRTGEGRTNDSVAPKPEALVEPFESAASTPWGRLVGKVALGAAGDPSSKAGGVKEEAGSSRKKEEDRCKAAARRFSGRDRVETVPGNDAPVHPEFVEETASSRAKAFFQSRRRDILESEYPSHPPRSVPPDEPPGGGIEVVSVGGTGADVTMGTDEIGDGDSTIATNEIGDGERSSLAGDVPDNAHESNDPPSTEASMPPQQNPGAYAEGGFENDSFPQVVSAPHGNGSVDEESVPVIPTATLVRSDDGMHGLSSSEVFLAERLSSQRLGLKGILCDRRFQALFVLILGLVVVVVVLAGRNESSGKEPSPNLNAEKEETEANLIQVLLVSSHERFDAAEGKIFEEFMVKYASTNENSGLVARTCSVISQNIGTLEVEDGSWELQILVHMTWDYQDNTVDFYPGKFLDHFHSNPGDITDGMKLAGLGQVEKVIKMFFPHTRAHIAAISQISNRSVLQNQTSPQKRAYEWLINEDKGRPHPSDTYRIHQRFALATLYYATVGENWTDKYKFLTDRHECTSWRLTDDDGTFSGGVECNDKDHVTDLFLKNNRLVGNLPVEIGAMTALKKLRLPNNQLNGSIPSALKFANMRGLTHLYLYNNDLTGAIPSSIGDASNLEVLDLKNNRLSGQIPSTMRNLTSLNKLRLQRNNFTGGLENFCDKRYANNLKGDFYADCLDAGLKCPCCSHCCKQTKCEAMNDPRLDGRNTKNQDNNGHN